jgi:hypothetical protein
MKRDRLFISISTLPSAASTDVIQRLPQHTGTTIATPTATTIILTTCRTAPNGSRTAIIIIFYHTHPRIRRPHFTIIIHLQKLSRVGIHARNARVATIAEDRSPCSRARG